MGKLLQTGELRQSLKITSSMQQSISILQMSAPELNQFVTQELAKNPFLEDDTAMEDSKAKLNNQQATNYSNSSGTTKNSDYDFFSNITVEKSLKDHIMEQINIEFDNHKEKLVAYHLLDSLQSNGYLNFNEAEFCKTLKCPPDLIASVLSRLQTFDPPGIFARDLKECLKLQLKDKGEDSGPMLTLIANLELLGQGELKKLAKICEVDIEELKLLSAKLRQLNPKPGNGFLVEQTAFKLPDVILTIGDDNIAKLEINPESMPRLQLNHEYYLRIKKDVKKKEEKIFTNTEINSATNIIRGIEMRAKTILRVASCIVEEQLDFFTRGVMYLKPLTLNKIAEITGLNESTISRSTANKYISAPSGIFELKYFFSSSLSNTKSVGEDVSSTKVKELIKQIILSENAKNILSDEEIAVELKKFNVVIARRTVAKYREDMGFPTSSQRKRQVAAKG